MGRPATLRVDIVTNAKTRGIDQAESRLGKFGRGLGKAAKVGGAALVGIGVAAAAGAKQVIDAASREQQAVGAVSTVFGRHAKKVRRYAKSAADSVGLSRASYSELASVVGSQLQNMGVSQEKSAGKTDKLIGLGADLAATYGGSVSDAVAAVSSLMRGEADPIERYGVSIKQADISARLAADGLDGLEGKAAKTARTQALLALLTEQTGKAQGAFSRESNTLAGQQERLKAKFENLKSTLGKKLLPVATKVTAWAANKLLPAAMKLGRWLSKNLGPAFATVGRFINGRLIPAAKETYRWFMREIYPSLKRQFGPMLDGLRDAFHTVSSAIRRNSGTFRDLRSIVTRVWHATAPGRRILGVVLGGAFRVLGGAISDVIDVISSLIGWVDRAMGALGKIGGKVGAVAGAIGGLFGVGGLTTGGPVLVGGSPSYAPGSGLAGFSWSTASGGSTSDLLSAAASTGPGYVDRRDFSTSIKVEGALDPNAVARQIEQLLDRRDRRLNRRPA